MWIKNIFKLVRYFVFLVVEIYRANIAVVKLILNPKWIVEPELQTFKTKLQTPLGRVLLANSITLTPGTITVQMEEDELVVHCLDASFAEGLEDSEFEQRLKKLEDM